MKTEKRVHHDRRRTFYSTVFVGILALCLFISCQDKVNSDDLYTFTGETITSYVQKHAELSDFSLLLQKSRTSTKSDTHLDALLAARGHYTCFIPTNQAVETYLDSIYLHQPYQLDTISEATANRIVLNCIIDNGATDAYESTSFEVGALFRTTLSDRYVTISFDTIQGGHAVILVNGKSTITQADIKAENGIIHTVDRVLAPSNASLASLISQTDNLHIFSLLLDETGWADSLQRYRDEDYESNHSATGAGFSGNALPQPAHRYYGYTAFVETDSMFHEKWGIPMPELNSGIVTNQAAILDAIRAKCAEAYPDATSDNPKSENNAINQFISYHLYNGRISYNYLVHHYNELGYAPKSPTLLSIDIWEYYETMSPLRWMLKVTQSAQTGGIYINRHCTYDNTFFGTYRQTDCDRDGILIHPTNGVRDYNALNGYYYTLSNILLYDSNVPNKVLNERLRFDVCSLLPEMMTNNVRSASAGAYKSLPQGYLHNLTSSDESILNYLNQSSSLSGSGWRDFQGDELMVAGQYDVTLRMLPVPYDGTYELRVGMTDNAYRGMAQIYFGTNKSNLLAIGLPIDLRLEGTNPSVDWEDDDATDEETNIYMDKAMKNRGYMKAPKSFAIGVMGGSSMTTSVRTIGGSSPALRKVVWTGHLEAHKVYYLRLKSVLESTSGQLPLDYFELVPKSVYAGTEAEDIW